MEPSAEEKCICQICTCGRHRCRQHPRDSTLTLIDAASAAEKRYVTTSNMATPVPIQYNRPEIKKLQDNLQVQTGTFQNSSLLRTDFPEFQVKRPVIHRVNDQLKGSQGSMPFMSHSQEEYRKFSVERPEIRRLHSSLKINSGHMASSQTLSQDTYKEIQVQRPKRNQLMDQLTSEGEMRKTSNNQDDFRQISTERPVIKKLEDNLSIHHLDKFSAHARNDYGHHQHYVKPVRNKMADTLKFTGEMQKGSQSQEDYVELVAERPIIRKMQDNMVVKSDAKLIDKSIQHADFPQFQPKRPIIAKLTDNLKIEGEADLSTAYNKSYVQQQTTERPEIKRMHSNLAVGGGRFASVESVGRGDYPQHDVTRPVIMKPVNNLSVYEGKYPRNEAGRRSWSTPVTEVVLPAMNRVKQMESSIHFGSDSDFPGGMTSTTQESFTTLLGAKKSQMTRPRTSNQLQNWQLPKTSPDSTTRYQEDQKQLNGKNVTLPTLDSCPAAVLNQANNQSEKSNFKFTREFQNHKFYKPVTIA